MAPTPPLVQGGTYQLVVVVDPPRSEPSVLSPDLGYAFNEQTNLTNINETIDHHESPYPTTKSVSEAVGLILICLLGVVGNLLIAFTLLRRKQLKYPSNRLVLSLNISSVLFCGCILPFSISIVLSRNPSIWKFGHFWCQIVGFLSLLFSVAGAPTIAFIAIDRYVAIVRPMVYTNIITIPRSSTMAVAAWIFGLFVAFPPLFGFARFHYVPQEYTCSVDWDHSPAFSILYLLCAIIIPVAIVVYCYSVIFQIALKKCQRINIGLFCVDNLLTPSPSSADIRVREPKERQKVARSKTIHTVSDTGSLEMGRVRSSPSLYGLNSLNRLNRITSIPMTSKRPSFTWIQYQSPKKGFLTIFTVVGSFTLAWIPHGIKIAFQAVTLEQKLPIWFQLCSYWFLVSSFALHPFVYGLMNRAIRSEIFPAIFPPKNPALKGLPRKNSMRRISMPVNNNVLNEDEPPTPPPITGNTLTVLNRPNSAPSQRHSLTVDHLEQFQSIKESCFSSLRSSPLFRSRRISLPGEYKVPAPLMDPRSHQQSPGSSNYLRRSSKWGFKPPTETVHIIITPPPPVASDGEGFDGIMRNNHTDSGFGEDLFSDTGRHLDPMSLCVPMERPYDAGANMRRSERQMTVVPSCLEMENILEDEVLTLNIDRKGVT